MKSAYLLTICLFCLVACDPTTSNNSVVSDCRDFAPPTCIPESVSGNRTQEENYALDAYRYCYCMDSVTAEVHQYAAPTRGLLHGLNDKGLLPSREQRQRPEKTTVVLDAGHQNAKTGDSDSSAWE